MLRFSSSSDLTSCLSLNTFLFWWRRHTPQDSAPLSVTKPALPPLRFAFLISFPCGHLRSDNITWNIPEIDDKLRVVCCSDWHVVLLPPTLDVHYPFVQRLHVCAPRQPVMQPPPRRRVSCWLSRCCVQLTLSFLRNGPEGQEQ